MKIDRSKGRILFAGLLGVILAASVPLPLCAAPEVEVNILAWDKDGKPLAKQQESGVAKNLPGRPTREMAKDVDPLKKAGSDHGKAGQIQISDEITWADGADKLLEAPSGSVDLRYDASSGYKAKFVKDKGGGEVSASMTIVDAMAEVKGVFENELGTVDFGGAVEAQAKLYGSGDFRFDLKEGDVGASGKIGAVAGVSARIEGSYESPSVFGVKLTASGDVEGYLAAGAQASGDLYWKDGKLNIGGKAGAAFGLGGGVGGDVQLDFNELIAAANDAVGIIAAKAVAVANNAPGLGTLNEGGGGSCPVEVKVENLTIDEPASDYAGIKRKSIRPGEILFEGNTPNSEDVKKLVLLIHGWNPSDLEDPFAGGGFGIMREVWKANANVYQEWNLAHYNWHTDAATVSFGLAHSGTQAAEAAYLHGWYLANEITRQFPNIREVQFIAHSAGAWVARSAALGMKNKAGLLLQVTLLDPYMPTALSDDPGIDVPDSLTREKMKDVDPSVFNGRGATMVFVECYFHGKDLALGTNDPMPWNSAGTRQAGISRDMLQVMIDKINANTQSPMRFSLQKAVLDTLVVGMADFGAVGHAVPVDWYATTMLAPHCQALGWPHSLPFRQVQPSQGGTIVAVVDESGSMAGRKSAQAGEGVRMLANMLFGGSDLAELGLVGFNTSSRQISVPVKKDQEEEIARGVDLLRADGGTAIGEGLLEGLRSLQLGKNVAKNLVLLSDGENNSGDLESAMQEVEKSGIPVYTVGYEINAGGAQVLHEIAARTGGDFFDADVDNIQQVYASINARIEDRCVMLYKTDVIGQDEVRDIPLNVPGLFFPIGTSPVFPFSLAWPGSRLGLRVLDASGADVTDKALADVVRTATTLSGTLNGLKPETYQLRVMGEEVDAGGELFTLQVQSKTSNGIFVKPLQSSCAVGDPIPISGAFASGFSGVAEDLVFEVLSPGGEKTNVTSQVSTNLAGRVVWTAKLPAPLTPGLHALSGCLGDVQVYSGNYLAGTIQEYVSRRANAVSMLNLWRSQILAGSASPEDAVPLCIAIEYAVSVAKTAQRLSVIWQDMDSRWSSREVAARHMLKMLSPFVGNYGLSGIAISMDGRVAATPIPALRGTAGPLGADAVFAHAGADSAWIRIPLGNDMGMDSVFLQVEKPSAEEVAGGLKALKLPGSLAPWTAANNVIAMSFAESIPACFGVVEEAVAAGIVRRPVADACYRDLMNDNKWLFQNLRVLNGENEIVFDYALPLETKDENARQRRYERLKVEFDGRVAAEVISRFRSP